ncbi:MULTISPECIES: hypothetical protein [unclassified Sinorhizobium]|nr:MULTISPECIES: hypothetical protein [unclassified Sinorhizobium]MDK1374388.1 hypothetical protein [Sinorhizobium sp. 6-70]MDK1478959.1 hypothetical protein [Sinorhizobium sp. 6-117]
MKPRTILIGIIFLMAAVFALLIYDFADRRPAEEVGTRLPATTD